MEHLQVTSSESLCCWPCPPSWADAAGTTSQTIASRDSKLWGMRLLIQTKSLADFHRVLLAKTGSHVQPESYHWQRTESQAPGRPPQCTQNPILSTAGILLEGRWWEWTFNWKPTQLPGLVGIFVFLASALFLTRDIILSKQVSHHALLTEAWWLINTSIQIPRETQMPGWDEARKCSAALGRV